MLYLDLGSKIYKHDGHPDDLFELYAKKEWFEDDFVKAIVFEIDGSTVINYASIEHPYFGIHNYKEISAGAKNIILAYKTDLTLNGDYMGDNCLPMLMRICENKDLKMVVNHMFLFHDDTPVRLTIVNTNQLCEGKNDFVKKALIYNWGIE